MEVKNSRSVARPISTYFASDGELRPNAVVRILLAKSRPPGVRRALLAGLAAWIIAPDDIEYIRARMLLAIQWSREREFKKVLEIRPDTEAIHMNSYLMGKNDWLLEAFQHFGGERGLRNLQLREHLDLERRRNFNRAKVVSLVVSALHYHHVVLCAESPSYGRPSIKKAAEFVTKYESVNVTPATIQNEYWPRYQRSAAWIYAAMSFSRESDGQGIDQALEAGRLSTINRLLIGLAARARFVERLLVEIVENVPLTLTLGPPARPVPITSIAVPQFDEVRSRGYRELAIDRRFRDSAASIKDGDFR